MSLSEEFPASTTNCGARGVNDFCRAYGISRSTFYEQVREGRLRTVKLGKKTLVLASDEAAFVALLRGGEAE